MQGPRLPKWLLSLLPVVGACVVLAYLIARTWAAKDYYTGGTFAYALDDAYIHMALAKNLVQHGVFGATPFEFTSASSSPLWTLLLTGTFAAVGVREIVPFVLAAASSVAAIAASDHVLRRFKVGPVWRFTALAWLVFATPLVTLVYIGMEHALQIAIDVAFVYVAVRLLHREDTRWDQLAVAGVVLAAAATAIRYEGAVLVGLVAVLLAVRKRWALAAAVAAAGAATIVVWGLISVANGGFFLPNSVLVKSGDSLSGFLLSGRPLEYLEALWRQLTSGYPLTLLLAATIAAVVARLRSGVPKWHPTVLLAGLAVAVTVVHLLVGQIGWFFRYEDYMIVLLGLGLTVQLAHLVRPNAEGVRRVDVPALLAGALAVAALVTGAGRGSLAFESTPRAVENVYEQMYQTAHFLQQNPQYDSVAIGDLGAVSYFNDDVRILDLEGLAETGVPLEVLGRDHITEEVIAELAEEDKCDIAVVYPEYFDLPDEWVEVAYWRISNNVVAYTDTVVFVAIPPTDPEELAEAVREYSMEQLPKTVEAGGIIPPKDDE